MANEILFTCKQKLDMMIFLKKFGMHKGFDAVKSLLENTNDFNEVNLLLRPIATCSEYLNMDLMRVVFENTFRRLIESIKNLQGDDFKDKNTGRVFDLLITMKKLSISLWPHELPNFHRLHLDVVLNMLKNLHFNSKMNSLKEICKLIESSKTSYSKESLNEESLSEWIITERILSLAVEGNIDQVQYCDKIKTIVDFIGDRINNEEISALWAMQFNKSMSIVDNLYTLIGIAATKFNQEQLDYLIEQIKTTWSDSSFKLHDKLVGLLRMIGRDSKNNKIYSRILEALWELKNRPGLSRHLLLLIYNEHLNVLSGGRLPRDQAKATYLKKCCEYIKREPGSSIAIASLKHMYDILNSYQKGSSKSLKEVLTEIIVPIMKVLCTSLLKCHQNASLKAKSLNVDFDHLTTLNEDDIFTHEQVVRTHLNSMKFILQEGNLYLNLSIAQEIWTTLIENENSCSWDKQVGFEWFIDCWLDLNDDTKSKIFANKILNLNPKHLTQKGYECFRLYFLRCNENESKLQVRNDLDNINIDKLDLTGLNYLWDIILNVGEEKLAQKATKFLLDISYEKVSLKLKREIVQLHQRFINECYTRLENCLITLDSNPIGNLLLSAFRISLSAGMIDLMQVPVAPRSEIMRCLDRILMVAEKYILTVEEGLSLTRTNPAHYLSFKAESFAQMALVDTRNPIEINLCSNETLGDLRNRVSSQLNVQMSNFQMFNQNDKLLSQINDYKLLSAMGIDGMMPIYVKIVSSYPASLNQTCVKDHFNFNQSKVDLDQEKCLPGVLISANSNSFDMFDRLEAFGDSVIKCRIRNILKLIPTNPKLLEAFDKILLKSNSSTSTACSAASSLFKSPSSSSIIEAQAHQSPTTLSQSNPATPVNRSFLSMLSRTQSIDQYFDKASLPLNRLLYNLEALSSKLMPSLNNQDQQQTNTFQSEFLKSNGLKVLINLLQLDASNALDSITKNAEKNDANEYETKQDILLLVLQLLRLLIFGSLYPLNSSGFTASGSNKRPSSEPISNPCSAKKTVTETMVVENLNQATQNLTSFTFNNSHNQQSPKSNDKSANFEMFSKANNKYSESRCEPTSSDLASNTCLVDKMSLSEVNELIHDLLLLFWSAGAGNIQLSSTNTSSSTKSSASNTLTDCQQLLLAQEKSKDIQNEELTQDQQIVKKEVKFFIPDQHGLSAESNMSTSSLDSLSNSFNQFSPLASFNSSRLQPGACLKNKCSISVKDAKIAAKSIELIECFVQMRKDCLNNLFSMKIFNDSVLDVLTGSSSTDIRVYMEKFLLKMSCLSSTTESTSSGAHLQQNSSFTNSDKLIRNQLVNIIVKARLPLWVNSSLTRSSNQRLISQSSQYFNLRCQLLENMSIDEQRSNSIDLKKMLNDQLSWFVYFTPTKSLKQIDNVLLTGHLCLTKSLLTCESANKDEIGEQIIELLIKTYLFPASYFLNYPSEDSRQMEPICSTESSRLASFKLLVELSRNCYKNYEKISKNLIKFHHSGNQSAMSNEWNLIPLVVPRAECGYVGLKNGGATCYMNAVLQQLYMIPGIADYLLSIEDESLSQNDDQNLSVYCQLQNVMAHLKESKLEYYGPEAFWRAFRMWGQEVNIREQQDAFDFFISMTDQIDEYLSKKLKKEPVFKNVFEGTFSNQFICKDCPHSYEREEVFLGLNLPIKSGNLEESLLQFVKDELLDGDNSYNCEKCNEKRSAIKRTCIKKLPKYLCIQLKRFDYDWESNRSLKFDDYFEFPRKLNVSPYTFESINKKKSTEIKKEINVAVEDLRKSKNEKEINYDLVGIVVHSGQASAGHYYSFIKQQSSRKVSQMSIDEELYELEQMNQSTENDETFNNVKSERENDHENADKWFKFNDTQVEEIDLSDKCLIEECFGGTFTQTSDYNKMLPEERVRYWNGYMLFYKEPDFDFSLKNKEIESKSKEISEMKGTNKFKNRKEILTSATYLSRDSLSELTELVSKGDEKGLFKTGLPPSIELLVKSENLEFCKNRAIYDHDYFQFIYNMVYVFKDNTCDKSEYTKIVDAEFNKTSAMLALEFLYNTFLKTGKKLRIDLAKWLELFKDLSQSSKEACLTILNFVVNKETSSNFIRHYLLECPIVEIREASSQILENCLNSLILKFDLKAFNNQNIVCLVTTLVQLLDKACIDLSKNSNEYFKLLYFYANISKETAQQLISMSIFNKLFCFLMGNPGQTSALNKDGACEHVNRRWSSMQLREFSIIYELISTLVLKCNILSMRTCVLPSSLSDFQEEDCSELHELLNDDLVIEKKSAKVVINEKNLIKQDLLPIPQEIQIYLFGVLSQRYLKELVYAFEQINPNSLSKTLEMILSCCYCNEQFSSNVIHQILLHINSSSSNEVKQALGLLFDIISIEDSLQLKRLSLALDGFDNNDCAFNGLLSIVRLNQSSDAKKSYHCVKFIVALANQNVSCKDYLLKTVNNWEWAVNWLKTKMSESNFSSTNFFSNSKFQSNEDNDIRTFQRTKSAQRTLEDATALLRSSEFDV